MAEMDYVRNLANEARDAARQARNAAWEWEDSRFAQVVSPLADAIDALVGILEVSGSCAASDPRSE